MENVMETFETILDQILDHAETKAGDLVTVSDRQLGLILSEWNETAGEYAEGRSVTELMEDVVRTSPEATALVYKETRLSYGELNARANQLAHYLQEEGHVKGPDTLVALFLDRNDLMVVGMLGLLKAGG
jgi:non-ribosomal peptide synthetase component F